jgi:alpha-glucosidase
MHTSSASTSRRAFLAAPIALALGASARGARAAPGDVSVESPDGKVVFQITQLGADGLRYQVRFGNRTVIEASALGVVVDGTNLATGAAVEATETYRLDEKYAVLGGHSQAVNRCNGARVALKHTASKTAYTLEIRAFNDGVAFRFVIPGGERARVPDEATTFTVPEGSTVWYHGVDGHYEGVHTKKGIAEVAGGAWVAPPLTIKLPKDQGFAAITESALTNYSGMVLQADGKNGFAARLGHSAPPSYPFRLRYAQDVERLSKPAEITGTITTPWRVVVVGADLGALVNSDIVTSLASPPDAKLFPRGVRTEWIRAGRAVWRYLDGGENTVDGVKEFSRLAGELGFEYQVVEGFWSRWTDDQIKDVVADARLRGVGLWFWRHSKQLRTSEEREAFFKKLSACGVVGAKIDFFDHEHREVVDLYQTLLAGAAKYRILVNFHGANKPTGETRTWPNELIREGVRGMEASKLVARAQHNTTLPFTRYLAGSADYTPVHFGTRRGDTTWAHQIATAVVFTEPLLTFAAHPKSLLDNPAVEMIKSIPTVWDQTVVLPGSEIGELAAFARRSENAWFLAVLNGPSAHTVTVPLTFLAAGNYQALEVRDDSMNAAAVRVEKKDAVTRTDSIKLVLGAGGGFIGRFLPQGR